MDQVDAIEQSLKAQPAIAQRPLRHIPAVHVQHVAAMRPPGASRPALVLDSELAGSISSSALASNWLRHRQPEEIATPGPHRFDVLYVNGRDVAKRPLRDRRLRLETLLDRVDLSIPRSPGAEWSRGLGPVLERGYEGLVAKDEASVYVGGRTRSD